MEEWRNIVDCPGYEISNQGRVRNRHNVILETYTNNGYKIAQLMRNRRQTNQRVHRLVAKAFLENPENKTQVNHKNKDKFNNCVENLEWCSPQENMAHYHATTRKPRRVPLLFERGNERMYFETSLDAGRYFGIAPATIWGYSINGKYAGWKITRLIDENGVEQTVEDAEDNNGTHLEAE